jgi:hypothetical protein
MNNDNEPNYFDKIDEKEETPYEIDPVEQLRCKIIEQQFYNKIFLENSWEKARVKIYNI